MSAPLHTSIVRSAEVWTRLGWSLVAGGLIGLLAVAFILRPDPRGMGTHQQLGLPPCTSIMLWGLPCPACGMTTSWAHFVRGAWHSSLRVNPGGFLLALEAVAVLLGIGWTLLNGKLPTRRFTIGSLVGVAGAMLVAVVHWAVRLLG